MEAPKFIITMDGYLTSSKSLPLDHSSELDGARSTATLRLGMVNQHKDLLIGDDSCIGGGYYRFDWTSNRLLLDGFSYDFGEPRWHLLDTLYVPAQYRGLRLVYSYNDRYHEDFNVSDELNIKYYD